MINFRYHVVSLTAVFLALAIGLVVGTAALNGPVSENLRNNLAELNKDNNVRREQVNKLNDEVNRNQEFAAQIAPMLLGGKLAGRKLTVVSLPGAEDAATGVVTMLKVAGATISSRMTVEEKFFDPNNANELLDLADQSTQNTVPGAGLPLNSDGVETASALLALALTQSTAPVQPSADDVTAVLAAFTKPGYISVEDGALGGAEAVVLVSGVPATDAAADKKSRNALTVATQFSGTDRPTVVAGDDVGDGNLVSGIRNDPTLNPKISTLDNVSTVQGQVATALVVWDRLVQGKIGHYGLGTGVTAIVPSTAP
ncbi:MAG TPA: copper transporter [Actinoplanes sp.]|nr:copper transporter [Actinoplanes sp.]